MFNLPIKIMTSVILGLCAWSWGQSQQISHLRAENLTQAQTITDLKADNKKLTQTLVDERKAIEEQYANEQQQREKADDDIKIIYRTIEKDNCAKQSMPGDVIKRLQQSIKQN